MSAAVAVVGAGFVAIFVGFGLGLLGGWLRSASRLPES